MSSSHNDHLFCAAGHILPRVTIGAIPDDILLEIFDFVLQGIKDYSESYHYYRAKRWNRLVHLCKRWRYLVFASPLRLDLRLFCSGRTPVREALDVWPPLPIEISTCDWDANIVAALEHRDRVRRVGLDKIPRNQLAGLMPEPFPALEHLSLATTFEIALVFQDFPLPSTFLGGSAPRL
jgi:F-box-like